MGGQAAGRKPAVDPQAAQTMEPEHPLLPTGVAESIPAQVTRYEIASWAAAAAALLMVPPLHLLPALFAGLLVCELVHLVAPPLQRHLTSEGAKRVAVAILATVVVAAVTLAVLGVIAFFRSEIGSLPALLKKVAQIIEGARSTLPQAIAATLPTTTDEIREAVVGWLREHASAVQGAGKEVGRVLAHIVIGMVVGALVALHGTRPTQAPRPLAQALAARAARLSLAFRRVVFAQVSIAGINTALTAIYLTVMLPAVSVHLPLTKTMIVLTFVVGLLPIVGNIVSNTVIVLVSLGSSLYVAGASLAFLVLIHKLEYFLNAQIVGAHTHSRAWELLIAMLTMEAAFGLGGLVAAPIYYAYLKDELSQRGLV
jgi:predicted PurR-regulated permease PerM